jgi:hypothetical protein
VTLAALLEDLKSELNRGRDVPIASAALGYTEELDDIGVFTRILVAGTPSVGTATYSFTPLEVTGLP